MKVEVEQLELSTIVASLGKSRHYFESIIKDQGYCRFSSTNKTQANKTRRKRRRL